MTEKLKAEAYVYQKRPALVKHYETSGSCTRKELPINLQEWLGVLWESNPNLEYTDAQMPFAKFGARAWYGLEKAPSDWIWFDAITGQPATQADYASFCAIMEL